MAANKYPGVDEDHKAHQDDRARQYLRVKAKSPNASTRRGLWAAYQVANVVHGYIGTDLESPDAISSRIVSLMAAHWNNEVFTREQLETFARYGVADREEQARIQAEFDDETPTEEKNDFLEFLLTEEERAANPSPAEMAESVAHYQNLISGRLTPCSPTAPSTRCDFRLETGRLDSRITRPQPKRRFTMDGVLPEKCPVVLSGFGGAQKTRILLYMAICIAVGIECFGKRTAPGCVFLVLAEDDQLEIDRRVAAIVSQLRLTPEQIRLVIERLVIFPAIGMDIRLTVHAHGSSVRTGLADTISARCGELRAQTGLPVKLIGLDNYGLMSGGEINSNEDAIAYSREAAKVAEDTGATVVTICHHRKASAGLEQDAQSVMGASAIVNSARVNVQSTTMSREEAKKFGKAEKERREYTRLSIQKANAVACGDVCWLHSVYLPDFDTVALERVDLAPARPDAETKLQAARESIWSKAKDNPGRYSVSQFAQRFSQELGLHREKLRSTIQSMLDGGYLELRPPTEHERQAHKLTRQTTEVIDTKKPLPSSEYQDPQEPIFEGKS